MKWFSLKGAIVFYLVYSLLIVGLMRTIGFYYGLPIDILAPIIPIIYFLVYVWKWDKGEATFP